MKRLILFVFALVCALSLMGCSRGEDDGGFIRKTCTGTVEEQISDESGDYLRVDTEGDGLLELRLTDSTEFTDAAAVSVGDTVEVVGPDSKPFSMVVPPMEDLEGNALLEPKTPQSRFTMRLPRPVPPLSFVRHAVALSARD